MTPCCLGVRYKVVCLWPQLTNVAWLMLQWGSLGFHKKSLANLAEAMKRTRKLCAVMIDSVRRELIINRPTQDDEDGWPTFEAGIAVEANQKASPLLSPVQAPSGTSWPLCIHRTRDRDACASRCSSGPPASCKDWTGDAGSRCRMCSGSKLASGMQCTLLPMQLCSVLTTMTRRLIHSPFRG